jgi:hypothetical protein
VTDLARGRGAITELKIPAQPPFVVVAKRAAAALGSAAGFSLEGIDDLNIAVAQACEKAIAAGDRMWGRGNGVLRLTFKLVGGGMEVEVKSLPGRGGVVDEEAVRQEERAAARIETMRRAAKHLHDEADAEQQRRRAAASLRAPGPPADRGGSLQAGGLATALPQIEGADFEDVAVNMIRLFVDELRYNVDAHGSMRMRMVKYLVD